MKDQSIDIDKPANEMGSDTYGNKGFMYNYNLHPITEKFLDFYFSRHPTKTFIQRLRQQSEVPNILDLCSGNGYESDRLRTILPSAQIFSLDYSTVGSQTGKQRFNLNQVQADANLPPFPDNQFDGIHCKDVLVHIPDKTIFLQNISRMLTKGGVFMLVSAETVYENYVQYSWNLTELKMIAKQCGLKLISKRTIDMKQEDWYSTNPPRIFMIFEKV